MDEILTGYDVNEPTWFYLSFLLITAVFFKFGRIWSLRNVDLVLLLLISPGLLILQGGDDIGDGVLKDYGYVWMFSITGLLLVRMFFDTALTRRPQLGQNLNTAGMSFLCLATFLFLMTKAITETPAPSTVQSIRRAQQILERQDTSLADDQARDAGPAADLLNTGAAVAKDVLEEGTGDGERLAAIIMAIAAHLAVVLGLLFLARLHFGSLESGLAMVCLYLLLPCTAYDVGNVVHVLPPALIIWALTAYRRPLVSGALMGLACGTLIFPIFLLPIWLAFYGRRGALRFSAALGLIALLLLGTLAVTSVDTHSFLQKAWGQLGVSQGLLTNPNADGFWEARLSAYRIPVMVTFGVMVASMTIWPRAKTLAHLMSYSAAIVVGTQFWYPNEGGIYVLWYLPLLLAVMFRPALLKETPPELKPLPWFKKSRPKSRDNATPTTAHPAAKGSTQALANGMIRRPFLR